MYNAREMDSLLLSSNFRYATAAADFTKTKVIMHPELNNYRSNNYVTTEVKELSKDSKKELQGCSLTGYQSGPSTTTSFFDNLCTDTVGGLGGADYLDKNNLSIEEMDCNAGFSSGDGDIKGSKKEVVRDSGHLVYEADGDVVSTGTGNMLRNSMNEVKFKKNISSANCSNLIRQSSSPAGFFSNLADEIGKLLLNTHLSHVFKLENSHLLLF